MKNIKLSNLLMPPLIILLTVIPANLVYDLNEGENFSFLVLLYVAFSIIAIVLVWLGSKFWRNYNEIEK